MSNGVSLGSGFALKETQKAILIQFDDESELWIPLSVIHDDSEVWEQDQEGNVVVKQWWAEKNV